METSKKQIGLGIARSELAINTGNILAYSEAKKVLEGNQGQGATALRVRPSVESTPHPPVHSPRQVERSGCTHGFCGSALSDQAEGARTADGQAPATIDCTIPRHRALLRNSRRCEWFGRGHYR